MTVWSLAGSNSWTPIDPQSPAGDVAHLFGPQGEEQASREGLGRWRPSDVGCSMAKIRVRMDQPYEHAERGKAGWFETDRLEITPQAVVSDGPSQSGGIEGPAVGRHTALTV